MYWSAIAEIALMSLLAGLVYIFIVLVMLAG